MNFTIHNGNSAEILKQYPDNHFDSIVTDPPYLIGFLGKDWDAANNKQLDVYQECLRVLKPGGHILAFSAARTYHHLAITLEQAGFEIRDQLMWLYASGFPKAQDIGKAIQRRQGVEKTKEIPKEKQTKTAGFANNGAQEKDAWSGVETVCTSPEAQQWAGWKTSLKPAHEPICMARKPFKGSTIDNVLANGLGALNIDATRVESYEPIQRKTNTDFTYATESKDTTGITYDEQWHNEGRFPSNVIGEVAGYQKYFYCPKVSRKERHTGFDTANIPQMGSTHPDDVKKHPLWDPSIGGDAARLKRKIDEAGKYKGNNHPTVKPVELMKYLIKLVTPENSVVLDPFCGSGSTGMAAVELGHQFIGCELDENYVRIAETRITAWNTAEPSGTTFEQLFE